MLCFRAERKLGQMSKINVADLEQYKEKKLSQFGRAISISPDVQIGGKEIVVMAGPCSIESEEQFVAVAEHVANSGASVVRGGIFKPRTSPYSFQGLGTEGIQIVSKFKKRSKRPVVSEIIDVRMLEAMHESVDVFQVGSRNMYNYPLLKELGRLSKPVLLKRGLMATIDEFVGAAEYILSHGNGNVILCERGIRSFDQSTRFCLDLTSVPILKEKLKLPIVVDPSHGTGIDRYVLPMSLAAIAAGADGLMIEVHNNPAEALSDGMQSLTFDQFSELILQARKVADAIGRSIK